MTAIPFLTPIQSRILVAFVESKETNLNTESVLRVAKIANSTWAKEQNKLLALGLIEKRHVSSMSNGNISRVASYKLADRGRMIGFSLLNISRVLATNPLNSMINRTDVVDPNESGLAVAERRSQLSSNGHLFVLNFERMVLECVEIGLESFGMNLDKLVRQTVEAEIGIAWQQISKVPEKLVLVLRELFGEGGSRTLEMVIAANIRSRIGIGTIKTDNLPILIDESRKAYETLGHMSGIEKEMEEPQQYT